MWVIALFDLPMDSKEARKQYTRFRKALIRDGFMQMQYSVYLRHASSRENADVHVRRVEQAVPENGEVRVFTITDKQYSKMRVFWGKNRVDTEKPPPQLELF